MHETMREGSGMMPPPPSRSHSEGPGYGPQGPGYGPRYAQGPSYGPRYGAGPGYGQDPRYGAGPGYGQGPRYGQQGPGYGPGPRWGGPGPGYGPSDSYNMPYGKPGFAGKQRHSKKSCGIKNIRLKWNNAWKTSKTYSKNS
ncbi:hypothetical protein BGP_6555 [Beggiatoa sp. PS]|nr:hypothetical protein BGP_6555 [Beggiatoa sp. PS]